MSSTEAGTSASFFAPFAGIDVQTDRPLDELAARSQACNYLVPSFDPRYRSFEPLRYWAGLSGTWSTT